MSHAVRGTNSGRCVWRCTTIRCAPWGDALRDARRFDVDEGVSQRDVLLHRVRELHIVAHRGIVEIEESAAEEDERGPS
jgi:hypothetical protein